MSWKLVKFRTAFPEDINWESCPELLETRKYFLGIDTVYLVNTDHVTHLCELAGSYELLPVYSEIVVHTDFPEVDYERERETNDWIDLENPMGIIEYIHCSDFEAKILNGSMQVQDCGLDISRCESHEEEEEMLTEYYMGNPVL